MSGIDLEQLGQNATEWAGFSPDRQRLISETGKDMLPNLGEVTNNFYRQFKAIKKVCQYPDAKLAELERVLSQWLASMFTRCFDAEFVKSTIAVGESYVKLNLPLEFMTGTMTLLGQELTRKTLVLYADDMEKGAQVVAALYAMLAYCQIIMQAAYKVLEAQNLEKFLAVTGMSHALYAKLARAYE
jgi:hypothetical protein